MNVWFAFRPLEQAIEQDGVYNIFAQAGKKNPEISILSDEYMDKIRKMKHKNIADRKSVV